MDLVLTVLHVIVCIFLVAVVLLQRGRGAQVGAVFGGGGGATMFGSRGAGNFLTKLTTGAAFVFMLTSLFLSYLGTSNNDGLFEDGVPIEATESGPALEEFGLDEGTTALPELDIEGTAPLEGTPPVE